MESANNLKFLNSLFTSQKCIKSLWSQDWRTNADTTEKSHPDFLKSEKQGHSFEGTVKFPKSQVRRAKIFFLVVQVPLPYRLFLLDTLVAAIPAPVAPEELLDPYAPMAADWAPICCC